MEGSGMKESEGDRLKYAVCESTLSTATRSPFPNGEGYDTRAALSPYRQSEYMLVWKNNTPGKAFPDGEGFDTGIPLFSTQRLSQGGSQRRGGFAVQKGSQPRLAALGSPFQGKGLAWTLPPSCGRRCPEGAEVGWGKRYEKERGDHIRSTIHESTLCKNNL